MNINGVIFLCVTNMSMSNMFMVVNLFCAEIPIFLREHHDGMYSTLAYFISKQLVELPLLFIKPIIFASIIYFMVGLNESSERFAYFLLILELLTQCAVSFGYFVSCLAATPQIAMAIAAPLMIPFMLFGGFFINDKTIPGWIDWMKYLSWFKYGNEALMINQWAGLRLGCPAPSISQLIGIAEPCFATGEQVLHMFGFEKENLHLNIICLVALIVGFKTIAFFSLLSKTIRRK